MTVNLAKIVTLQSLSARRSYTPLSVDSLHCGIIHKLDNRAGVIVISSSRLFRILKELSLSLHKSFSPLLQIWHRKKWCCCYFFRSFRTIFGIFLARVLLRCRSSCTLGSYMMLGMHAGLLNVALYGLQLIQVILLLRRPHFKQYTCLGWI